MMRIVLVVLGVAGLTRAVDTFDPARQQILLASVSEAERPRLVDALKDAGSNWTELAAAFRLLDGERQEAAVWLIIRMPHLDRLEMTTTALVEHVEYAFKAKAAFRYAIPDSLFYDYILTYRISDEPVEGWRKALFDRFAPMGMNTAVPAEAARRVNRWVNRTIKPRPSEFFGPLQSPLSVLSSRRATDEETAILTCAILKSLGVPSRRVTVEWLGEEEGGASWVEIFSRNRWLPLYPLDADHFGSFGKYDSRHPLNVTAAVAQSAFEQREVTGDYSKTGIINLYFHERGAARSGFKHFSVNVFNGGGYRALDAVAGDADSTGRFRYVLGDGRYQLLVGIRDSTGSPYVTAREITVKAGDTLDLNFDVGLPVDGVPEPK